MSVSSATPGFSGIRKVITLTSGTSWTVPDGVTYVNATLIGGGGGSGSGQSAGGTGGTTTFAGATSALGGVAGQGEYSSPGAGNAGPSASNGAVGAAGGGAGTGDGAGGQMVTTTVATTPGASIAYAIGAGGTAGPTYFSYVGAAGGAGRIDLEYWQ